MSGKTAAPIASTAPALPYDVWANIASFIPQEALRDLYTVNQALFQLSLDAKYGDLCLTDPLEAEGRLQILEKDSFRAGKVRRFKLDLQQLGKSLDGKLKHGFDGAYYIPPKKGKKAAKKKVKEVETRLMMLQKSLDIVRALPNLQECVVDDGTQRHRDLYPLDLEERPSTDLDAPMAAIPIVLGAWNASTSSLRRLRLSIAVETLDSILPPGLKFDNLAHLEITLLIVFRSTDSMNILLSSLVPFINRHCRTLRSFALRTKEHLPLTLLFKQLYDMPVLRNFGTTEGYVSTLQTDTSGLHEFLTRHTETLRSLSLTFYSLGANLVRDPLMEDWIHQPCLHVTYPRLTRLSFGLHDFPSSFGAKIHKSLDSFWASKKLQHLLLPMELSLDDLKSIFCEERDLRSLSLITSALVPEVFDLLSVKLPRLLELELKPTEPVDLHPKKTPDGDSLSDGSAYRSCNSGMAVLEPDTWGLRHLFLILPEWMGEPAKATMRKMLKVWYPRLVTLHMEVDVISPVVDSDIR